MASQLRGSLGKLQPALTNLAADEIPYHIGASGPFHLADSDTLHVTLQLEQQGAAVTGSGTVAAPVGGVGVTGTWTDPNLSLTLDGPADTLRLVAALSNDNVLTGTLARSVTPGSPTVPLTLYRQ